MALLETVDESDGEGYFASVSDMMVGILFIFLLLLTVFALNYRDAEREQKVKLAEFIEAQRQAQAALERANAAELKARREAEINGRYKRLLLDAVAQLEKELKDREKARTQLLVSLQTSLMDQGVRVTIDPNSGILRLPEDLLFKTGDAAIQRENLPRLQKLAQVLADTLPCYVRGGDASRCDGNATPILETVLVEGHTDRQAFRAASVAPPTSASAPRPTFFSSPPPATLPIRNAVVSRDSDDRNDHLSTERALNVFKELRRSQPSLDDLRNSGDQPLLGFSGYGPRRPLSDALGSSPADYQRNRRIDLRFVLSPRTADELTRLATQIREALGNNQ